MKKIISLLLTVVMVLGICAVPSFANTTVDTSDYTKNIFVDGGDDFTDTTPMTIDKWNKTTIGAGNYNGSCITADGYLTVKSIVTSEIQGVTPKVTLPQNYVAEMTGIFSNQYCHNAAIRLKTVDTTNYYLLACWDGTNSGNVKYGISTDVKTDMNATYLGDTFSIARTETSLPADWKFVVADNTIEVWVNGELKLTYTNDDFAGTDAVTHFDPVFYSPNNYTQANAEKVLKISEMTISRKATGIEKYEDKMTKVFFEDGGEDNSVTPMTMAKWTKTTVGAGSYNSSNVNADGVLEVRATTSNEIQGVTPNTVIPENYIAEFSGKFYGSYNHQTAIRFKTVGTTNYYIVSTYLGNSQYKYGIGTDTDVKKDMLAPMVSGAPTFTLAAADAQAAADWKIIVAGDSAALYRNDELKISYTNEAFAGTDAVTHFDPVFFSFASYSADTAKKVLNITSAKLYREESEIEKAEKEMTAVIYENDFETATEINTGDWSLWSAKIESEETFRISEVDGKKAMEIAQLKGSLNRVTTAYLNTGDAADYVLEAKLKIGASYPDSFAIKFRNLYQDETKMHYYALGYARWLNNSNGSLGVTKPNGFMEATNYSKQLTSYGKDFISEWHDYKIVVSGMTAAIYLDGTLVSEQTLNEGYEKGGVAFSVFNNYGGVTNGPISMYIDSVKVKSYPTDETRLFGTRTAFDDEKGTLLATTKVFAKEDETMESVEAVLVIYEDGVVKEAQTVTIPVVENKAGEAYALFIDEIDLEKDCSARLFVWDGLGNLKPVEEAKDIKLNIQE